jgi:hypothetical protein
VEAFRECGPAGALTFDAEGNLDGTTYGSGAYEKGNVYKLTPSNGSWTYTSLHDFTGGADGGDAYGNVAIDANGNLYVTASMSSPGSGVVWELTRRNSLASQRFVHCLQRENR